MYFHCTSSILPLYSRFPHGVLPLYFQGTFTVIPLYFRPIHKSFHFTSAALHSFAAAIQRDTIQCKAIQMQCSTIPYNEIQCNTITTQWSTMQYYIYIYISHRNAMRYNTKRCHAVQYSTTQCNTMQCNGISRNAVSLSCGLLAMQLPCQLKSASSAFDRSGT